MKVKDVGALTVSGDNFNVALTVSGDNFNAALTVSGDNMPLKSLTENAFDIILYLSCIYPFSCLQLNLVFLDSTTNSLPL